MENPHLSKVTFEFSQDGNTDGTTGLPETDGWEELIIEVMSAPDSLMNSSGYLVLRTKTGWSINDPSELNETLNYITNMFNNEKIKV